MIHGKLQDRTKALALRVIRLVEALPRCRTGDMFAHQLSRCGTSIGANYRVACRAKSHADFIHKLAIAEEEADETVYWLELLAESNIIPAEKLGPLRKEVDEIVAMLVASIKTAKESRVRR